MSSSLPEVVAAVRRVDEQRAGRTGWVGIDGRGAAGKTTLAAEVARAFPHARVVHVDDFAGPGIPEWDWERFIVQVRDPLADAGELVIVEGVSCTRSEAGVDWDLRIWVDAPYETRLRRARERDGEAMLPRWLDDWMPSEERYVAREHPERRADLIVDGTVTG